MTLFVGALAASIILAFVLWKLGDRRVEPSDPDGYMRLGQLVALVIWTLVSAAQAYVSWGDLAEVAQAIRGGRMQDAAAFAEKIETARGNLAVWGVGFAIWSIALLAAIADAIKAFMRRTSEKAAKLQETPA